MTTSRPRVRSAWSMPSSTPSTWWISASKPAPPTLSGAAGSTPPPLFKIYLWGCLNRTKFSRCLEHACTSDLTLIWLTGNLRPDHSTISDFRKKSRKRREEYFLKKSKLKNPDFRIPKSAKSFSDSLGSCRLRSLLFCESIVFVTDPGWEDFRLGACRRSK